MIDKNSLNKLSLIGQNAKEASKSLLAATSEQKNNTLTQIGNKLKINRQKIFSKNQIDLDNAVKNNLSGATIDRLKITDQVISSMKIGINNLIHQADPIGVIINQWNLQPDLTAKKVSVPIGVIGVIYESRPNVTIDAAILAIKSGNAIILRGSSVAMESNMILVESIQEALLESGLNPNSVQLIKDTSREGVIDFLKLRDYIDVMIPRGGSDLINFVVRNSSIPVIETGAGVCHIYVDSSADIQIAKNVLLNAKVQRPSVCNAVETLLIDTDVSTQDKIYLVEALFDSGVECFGCEQTLMLDGRVKIADQSNWSTEYQDLQISIKIVKDLDEAILHISQYGTKHSECIISNNSEAVLKFQTMVDAAVVYHNASTRFTDGFEFGFGAELGISTQKLHARGPMGLQELTTYKYLIYGSGNCR